MKVGEKEFQARLERFRGACRAAGVKLTPQRLEIFRAVARGGDHPDAEAVLKAIRRRLPTVSLDTVYRTLWLLVDLGLVGTLGPPRGRVRFDANTERHHHFLCTGCGLAVDFVDGRFDELPVPAAVAAVGTVESRHVELRGLCARCRGGRGGSARRCGGSRRAGREPGRPLAAGGPGR